MEAYDRLRGELVLAASTTGADSLTGPRSGRYFLSWGKEIG